MVSPAGAAPVTPKRLQKLQVLYLFSGAPRRADIASCLLALIKEFNASAEFTFVSDLEMEEVDIERGGRSHDLLDPVRRKRYLELGLWALRFTHRRATRTRGLCILVFLGRRRFATHFIQEGSWISRLH